MLSLSEHGHHSFGVIEAKEKISRITTPPHSICLLSINLPTVADSTMMIVIEIEDQLVFTDNIFENEITIILEKSTTSPPKD